MNFIKRHFNNKFFKQKGPSAFKKAYEAISKSKVYEQYCQRVHGQETKMLNTMALDQYQLLVERINELSPKTMLDLGCGNGELTKQISKELSIKSIGIDFSFMGKDVKGTQFKQIDTEHFKLEKKFDLILSVDSFYMIKNYKDFLKNLLLHLNPNGKVIILITILDEALEDHRLMSACKKLNLKVDKYDLTKSDRNFWISSKKVLEEMNQVFVDEDQFYLWGIKKKEADKNIALHDSNSSNRYLLELSI